MKIYLKAPNLFKVGHKYRKFCVQTWACFNIVRSDAYILTIHRTHCYASMAPISIFITLLTAPYVYKTEREGIVCFHGNIVYANA